MTEMFKCPECGKELEYLGKTGKLKHYYCQDCKKEYDIYEKEKSNNPKIKNWLWVLIVTTAQSKNYEIIILNWSTWYWMETQ